MARGLLVHLFASEFEYFDRLPLFQKCRQIAYTQLLKSYFTAHRNSITTIFPWKYCSDHRVQRCGKLCLAGALRRSLFYARENQSIFQNYFSNNALTGEKSASFKCIAEKYRRTLLLTEKAASDSKTLLISNSVITFAVRSKSKILYII